MLVLLVGAAVVDDDVADRHDAGRLQRLVQLHQLLLGPVLARQVVQLAGQVPLRRTQWNTRYFRNNSKANSHEIYLCIRGGTVPAALSLVQLRHLLIGSILARQVVRLAGQANAAPQAADRQQTTIAISDTHLFHSFSPGCTAGLAGTPVSEAAGRVSRPQMHCSGDPV